MYRFRRKVKNKVRFFGHELVRMHDCCTREAIRFFRDGHLLGIIQKNGNVAVSATGIFDDENNKRARYKCAKILLGLKMTSQEFVDARKRELDEHERALELVSLEAAAKDLDMVVLSTAQAVHLGAIPMPKRRAGVRKDRSDPEGGIPGRA